MDRPEDFDRVGDLLGDVCEAAAAPTGEPVAATPEVPPGHTGGGRAAVGRSLEKSGGGTARELSQAWLEVAGAEVAANASPVHLRGGRLAVSTSSSVWAHTLQYMSEDLKARINERLGSEIVQQIVFRHAGWEERPPERRPGDVAGSVTRETMSGADGALRLTEQERQALEQVEAMDLPPAIRERVACAMRASFLRSRGETVR